MARRKLVPEGTFKCSLSEKFVKYIEEKYDAKFVIDRALPNSPSNLASLFYCKKKHPESKSHYAAFWLTKTFHTDGYSLVVVNGQPIADNPISAIMTKSGEILYSRTVHDFRYSTDKSVFVDGGPAYLRYGGNVTPDMLINLRIVKDKIYIDKIA